MLDLVGNPKDSFSLDKAHFLNTFKTFVSIGHKNLSSWFNFRIYLKPQDISLGSMAWFVYDLVECHKDRLRWFAG